MIFDYRNYVETTANKGLVNYISRENNPILFEHEPICPFCKIRIENFVYQNHDNSHDDWLFGSFDEWEHVRQCPHCGWWEYSYRNQSDAILDGIRASDLKILSATLRNYEDKASDVPVELLREYIQKHPEKVYSIDPHKMEELVRSVFRDFYPSCEVQACAKTRDGGKDAILINEQGNKYFVSIKRRSTASATEGVDVIRSLLGASVLDDAKGCIFVTTADHFSKDAKDAADKSLQKGIVERFDLFDFKGFKEMMEITKQTLPEAWRAVLRIRANK